MKKRFLLPLTILLIIVTSCERDETKLATVEQSISVENNTLEFKTADVFASTLNSLSGKSEIEKILWEESIGFESFNTICERIYDEVTTCEINSIEELEEVVAEHSKYLLLIQDSNGDYSLETQTYKNTFKAILNEEQVFIIGDNAYKVYDDFFVVTEKSKIKNLQALPSQNLNLDNIPESFEVIKIERQIKKGIATDCSNYDDGEAINVDAKRKVEAYHLVERFHVIDEYNGIYLTYARWYYYAVAKAKGIFWTNVNTLWSWDIDVNWHQSYDGGEDYQETTSHAFTSSDSESKTMEFGHGLLVYSGIVYPSVYFNNYDCSIWTRGTTASYKAEFSCY